VTGQCSFKFGITSGDARPRLRSHHRDGYVTVERLFTELPDGVARTLETTLIKNLAANGHKPVLRREYFPAEALDLVLSIVDEALGDRAGAPDPGSASLPALTRETPAALRAISAAGQAGSRSVSTQRPGAGQRLPAGGR
jgi:hypothetical protein